MGLLITRKINQGFVIGDNIHVLLIETWGKFARIKIEAPKNVPILRDEIIIRDMLNNAD